MLRDYGKMCLVAALALPATAARAAPPVQVCEALWTDPARAGRAIPVRIRMPAGTGRAPVILFSHGLGGSLDSGTDWVEAWAAAGFITVNIQHPGSDEALWKGQHGSLLSLVGAMNVRQLQARTDDVHVVLDRIGKGGHVSACDLGRADMSEIGMSGHSFGAQTTLAVSGANYAGSGDAGSNDAGAAPMQDRRVKAAIAFSPQPSRGVDDHAAFGGVTMPFFTITGTKDSFAALNGVSLQDRLRPYAAMPAGEKYLLVIDGANHLMLNGQTLPRPGMTPSPEMVSKITQATVMFWRATLMGENAAAGQLKAFGRSLRPGNKFSTK
jgi:predicted dienelactone hydrolase